MRETLEEVHRATMMDPRAAEVYGHLCAPGEKLCVFVHDAWPVGIQKPEHHPNQRVTWRTKNKENCLSRFECCDLEGRPVFVHLLAASSSPRATDEALAYYLLDLEQVTGLQGGFTAMLVGLPGYCMVHLFDNGYRYIWLI